MLAPPLQPSVANDEGSPLVCLPAPPQDAAAEAPRADLDADTQLEADPDMDMDDGGGGGGGAAADDFDDMD